MTARNLSVLLLLACSSFVAMAAGADKPPENKLPDEAHQILEQADKFVLYSLRVAKPTADDETLHDYPIVRKATVKSGSVRKELLREMDKLISESRGPARCFYPRHAIQASYEGKVVDLVICFECDAVDVYIGDSKAVRIGIEAHASGEENRVEQIFDSVLPKQQQPK